MGRRFVAIICIMFLLFTITSPISGSIFSYADQPQQEQLSQDEVIKAAIALYLNERKAWITSTTSAPIDAVQAQMQAWIDSYEFWTEHTNIGSAAAFYAQCIVKYNPFRISLKGPAVRALNDLYNWLIDTGKLPNLDSDNNGGETTDNLYDGLMSGNTLYSNVYGNFLTSGSYAPHGTCTSVNMGAPWHGLSAEYLKDQYNSLSGLTVDYSNYDSNIYYPSQRFTFNVPLVTQNSTDNTYAIDLSMFVAFSYADYRPLLGSVSPSNATDIAEGKIYSNRGSNIRGGIYMCIVHPSNNPSFSCLCLVTYSSDTGKYYIVGLKKYDSNPYGSTPAVVNLDTDNFNKTDPTPPEGDDEVTYTPEDKTTGDTYNTYNEYITNYVTKNTVVNNNNSGGGGGSDPDDPEDPETPGGTTPPWDNSSGAGTLTPDGNGGYNFNLPDLTLPDLNIDWSINGLKDKFPFSIPWDLMAFFTVLNAEPETPEFTGQVDLGIYVWDIDIDLHDFDLLAALVRNLEFIAFCIGLIIVTRSIIKG